MPANTIPITPLTQNVSWGTVATANTSLDGTGTVVTVFTAGANGSRIDQIRVAYTGTTVATVLRVFINNGSTNATAANNTLIHEVTLPINTLNQAAAATLFDLTIPKNSTETAVPVPYLPNGYKLNVTVGTSIATPVTVTVHGANY